MDRTSYSGTVVPGIVILRNCGTRQSYSGTVAPGSHSQELWHQVVILRSCGTRQSYSGTVAPGSHIQELWHQVQSYSGTVVPGSHTQELWHQSSHTQELWHQIVILRNSVTSKGNLKFLQNHSVIFSNKRSQAKVFTVYLSLVERHNYL